MFSFSVLCLLWVHRGFLGNHQVSPGLGVGCGVWEVGSWPWFALPEVSAPGALAWGSQGMKALVSCAGKMIRDVYRGDTDRSWIVWKILHCLPKYQRFTRCVWCRFSVLTATSLFKNNREWNKIWVFFPTIKLCSPSPKPSFSWKIRSLLSSSSSGQEAGVWATLILKILRLSHKTLASYPNYDNQLRIKSIHGNWNLWLTRKSHLLTLEYHYFVFWTYTLIR